MKQKLFAATSLVVCIGLALTIFSQQEGQRRMGFGPGPMAPDLELVKKFDANKDGWLDAEERSAARKALPELRQAAREKMGAGAGPRFGEFPPGGFPGGPPEGPPPNDRRPPDGGAPKDGPPEGPPPFPPGSPFPPGPPGIGPPGGPGGPGRNREPAKEGPFVEVDSVKTYPDHDLYDPSILRTFFINFEDAKGWEAELADFKGTDVEVPAEVIVDGKTYPNVGLKFRGNSSFMMTPATYKRSLNLSMDLIDKDQRLYGYKTLNLLNGAGDPSMLSAPIYAAIARRFTAAPKANLVKVVINGESWGVYENVQQFNKDFLEENLGVSKGARWKVPGRPGGDGGLRYKGDDVAAYKPTFEIKTADKEESWAALIHLCKVLNETPAEDLPGAIESLLDIDGALWFLANDIATVNSDGYWTRASDYNIYLDPNGKFHLYPYDMNEAFIAGHGPPGGMGGPRGRGGMGGRRGPPPGEEPPRDPNQAPAEQGKVQPRRESPPGEQPPHDNDAGRDNKQDDEATRGDGPSSGERPREFMRVFGPGGPGGGGGPDLDPLVGLDDPSKPLRSKLLAVPKYREQYLQNIRSIAEFGMAPEFIEPLVDEFVGLVKDEINADTKKLTTVEAFEKAVAKASDRRGEENEATKGKLEKAKSDESGKTRVAGGPPPRAESIREFFAARRKYLLQHKEIANLPGAPQQPTERVDMRNKK